MSDVKLPAYDVVEAALKDHGLAVTPSELHGLLSGMICGGMAVDDESWVGPVSDYANEGALLTDGAKAAVRMVFDAASFELGELAKTLFSSTAAELADYEFTVSMLLPADEAELMLRAEALSEWTTNFISGLGLMGLEKSKLSPEVTEAVSVLEEISQLGVDEDEDMSEQAQLFDNVAAYVPECVLTCLVELSQRPGAVEEPTIPGIGQGEKPTLH
ncbi:UPF0149 family protein [Photobacterium chitinilyticum]|uniref:YecA family protein n=1 Tax=Photobacterium chitinilyticum TaxID=2485123 RepID=A0A444JJP3_9GAMM|nr:UPF0149 family protein [Photobacterium chitinilyticum]RWX53282.1 YecA family protein [Photobacterium chitinilyticum]